MKKLKRWFGDETDSNSESSTETEDDDTDPASWKQIDRQEKSKLKKRKQKRNRKQKVAQTAVKASHLLGINPIGKQAIDYHLQGNTYEGAKILAVESYLEHYLKFNEQELKEMKIKETMVSAKGDDTIYIAFDNLDHIKEIHLRMAECQNPELGTRNYIPPGFYERFMAINRKCTEVRAENKNVKTQIRFNEKDIEILTKERGSNEPYKTNDLETFMGNTPLPEFDHTRKWTFRSDRPPRRKITYDRENTDPLAIHKESGKHQLSRHSSLEDKNKKSKHDISSSSGNADDEMSTVMITEPSN